MGAGRPAQYETAEALEQAIDAYFIEEKDKPTISGLAYHLGFESRQSFYDYKEREEFSYTIKRARLRVEVEYEKKLSGQNTSGAIFALKNLGWSDKSESEITHKGVTVNLIPAPGCEPIIEKDG